MTAIVKLEQEEFLVKGDETGEELITFDVIMKMKMREIETIIERMTGKGKQQ